MLMTKSAYAKHRGVSRQTVYDWIAKGEIVLQGNKVDVAATDKQRPPVVPQTRPVSTHGAAMLMDRNDEIEMTWREVWEAVKVADATATKPCSDDEARQRVLDAAECFNYDVEFTDEDGIVLRIDYCEHYFSDAGDVIDNAWHAIYFLRRDVLYTATDDPDEIDVWRRATINALGEW